MKKFLFYLIPAFALVLFISSCSKDDDNNNNNNSNNPPSAVGIWAGTGQYGSIGNPTYAFSLNLKADGTVAIVGNNSTAVDNATGTWQMVQDSIKATYKYASSSAIYRLSAKYTVGATVMTGTIGLDPVTSGVGGFSVTKQ